MGFVDRGDICFTAVHSLLSAQVSELSTSRSTVKCSDPRDLSHWIKQKPCRWDGFAETDMSEVTRHS